MEARLLGYRSACLAATSFATTLTLIAPPTSLRVSPMLLGYLTSQTQQDAATTSPVHPTRHATGPRKNLLAVVMMQILLALVSVPGVDAACAITPDASGNVEIPASMTSIGTQAFQSCISLNTVTFASGSSLGSIGNSAFQQSGLTTISIPASVTSMGTYAFYVCSSLKTVTFASGSSLGSIGDSAFRQSGLTQYRVLR